MGSNEHDDGGEGGKRPGVGGGFRVPAFVMIPVLIGVCWFVADWLGAIFGGVVGFLLWRSRR